LNANAGGKALRRPPTADELRELLERHGVTAEVVATQSEEEATRAARGAVRDGWPIVAAAGGDGTIGLIGGALIGTTTALGILPLGSVMNVPRMLGVPRDLEAAAAVLASTPPRPIDVGVANGRLFYENASVGMNAAMFKYATQLSEGDYGSLRRIFWLALRYRPTRIRLVLDGSEVRTRALMVTISNGPYTGVGMTVAPAARVDDGKFDVTIFRHFSKLELIRHMAAISFGRRSYTPHTRTYRAAHVVVDSPHRLSCRADSIDLGRTPLECTIRRGALRVIAPPPTAMAEAG
jgi:diacylglycerol kinase (ATP)